MRPRRDETVVVSANWNDDTSATTTSASPPTASRRGRPMLPAATARRPDASSMAWTKVVTVVLPLVPVMATIGHRARRHASSTSPMTGAASSKREHGVTGGHPGAHDDLVDGAGQGRSGPASSGADTSSMPKLGRAWRRGRSPASSSAATTSAPSDSSRAAVARPLTPRP